MGKRCLCSPTTSGYRYAKMHRSSPCHPSLYSGMLSLSMSMTDSTCRFWGRINPRVARNWKKRFRLCSLRQNQAALVEWHSPWAEFTGVYDGCRPPLSPHGNLASTTCSQNRFPARHRSSCLPPSLSCGMMTFSAPMCML